MTKHKGRGTRALPDLGLQPEPDLVYKPPGVPPAERTEYPVDLGEVFLQVRIDTYRGLTVDFAIMVYLGDPQGTNAIEMCRVDCCHGVVHRHDFRRDKSKESPDYKILCEIDARPEMEPWNVVDAQFATQYEVLVDSYDEIRRRWAE
ncbi:hypothetical protein [Kocuria sp.]|uniref:hypothetical protein n=1 Tax=Kocuria sp. TaxID=1871328 RepID=UPI0026DF440B|nr:hypothetical protein [Kocuria sp.]MDO5618190.1 hypothetical protein [Kocuria sp.]